MLLEREKILATLNKVRIVREHLKRVCLESQGPVLSVMNLHYVIQDIYGLQIEMLEVLFESNLIGGNSERYDGKGARILVSSTLSHELKRFVTIKELCHIMNDEKDEWSTLGVETIRGLMKEVELIKKNGDGHPTPTPALQSEMLAMIAAIELSYPFEFREIDIRKIAAEETTLAKIALEHQIPAYIVEHALDQHAFFVEFWNVISEKVSVA